MCKCGWVGVGVNVCVVMPPLSLVPAPSNLLFSPAAAEAVVVEELQLRAGPKCLEAVYRTVAQRQVGEGREARGDDRQDLSTGGEEGEGSGSERALHFAQSSS